MKSNTSKNIVITSGGVDGPKSFGMKVNEKAFTILISGIYQHKIKAIVRELSTNAWDSHKQAKNLVPYDVHLPTIKKPVFYIRDYGVGLDQTELEEIYFNFFASTKEDSNEYTGFIGIGSKVPLCYNTKSFNVESYKNGTQYIYSCFIGSNNVPDYKLEYVGPTTEKNGMKIQVAVNPSDIYEFESCAKQVYCWFQVKPNFVSDRKPNVELVLRENNNVFKIHEGTDTVAVMGNIAYPVVKCHGLNKYDFLLNRGIVLDFDIGDIEFNAAREGLEYTPKTIKKLADKFETVIDFVKRDVEAKIQSAVSPVAAIKEFYSLRSKYDMFGILSNISEIEYQGKKYKLGEKIQKKHTSYYYTRSSDRDDFTIHLNDKYVINDMKIGAKSRCKDLAKSSGNIVIFLEDTDIGPDFYFDPTDYILASTLPKPKQNARTGRKVSSFMEMKDTSMVSYAWKEADINNATSKYYIIRKGYYVLHDGKQYLPSDIYTRARISGFNDVIYGVCQKDVKEVIDAGFENIIDACNNKLQQVVDDAKKEVPFLEDYYFKKYMYSHHDRFVTNVKKIRKLISENSELGGYIKEYSAWLSNEKKVNFIEKQLEELRRSGYNIEVQRFGNYYYSSMLTDAQRKQIEEHPVYLKYSLLKEYLSGATEQDLLHYVIGVNYEHSRTQL